MPDETLLDAVNASLDGEDAAAPETDEEIETGDEGDTGTDEGDAAAEGEEGDAAAEGEEEGDAEGEEEGTAPKPKDGVAPKPKDGEKTPEQIAAEKAAKPKDPVNDPLPNALKKETKERMESLISTVKSVTGRAEKAEAVQAEFMSHIEATGATPEQYRDSLSVLGMLNSGEPAQVEQAITYLQQVIAANARVVGKPIAGVNMLEGHQDLIDGVNGGHISQEHAEELAAARERNKHQQVQSTQRQQAQQSTQQRSQELASGKTALNTLDAELRKDPQYAAKRVILVPALQSIFAEIPPSQWATKFKAAWDKLVIPAARPVRTQVPANQPMRAKAGAGGAVKEPGSMLDAVNGILGA